MDGAPNFTIGEFARASYRPLDMDEALNAGRHARELQRVRDALNRDHARTDGREWRVRITSYLRPGDGSDHQSGAALDWTVDDPTTGRRSDRMTKWARDWLATYRRESFDRLLWELDHVHHALRFQSRKPVDAPVVLDQTGTEADGTPVFGAAIIPGVDNALSLSVVLFAGVVGWLLFKGV